MPTDYLSAEQRQMLGDLQGTSSNAGSTIPPPSRVQPQSQAQQPVGPPAAETGLRSQLPSVDQLPVDSQGFNNRLQEFLDIRNQRDREAEELAKGGISDAAQKVEEVAEIMKEAMRSTEAGNKRAMTEAQSQSPPYRPAPHAHAQVHGQPMQAQQPLSLTEQVQKTQADAAAAAAALNSSGFPMPFPPPQSSTPLPAPTAQRARSNLPSQYSSRSASGTPDTTEGHHTSAIAPAPPTAPWAVTETQKGPSLKEIQNAEAEKAAKKQKVDNEARRAALEREAREDRERERIASLHPTGLPATSTWGTGSPVGGAPAGGSASPWANSGPVKTGVVSGASNSQGSSSHKKTLADIQREEEARKQRQRDVAQQASTTSGAAPPTAFAGKRYAELASKGNGPPGFAAGPAGGQPVSGWQMVGASGKVKIPTAPAQMRNASGPAATIKAPSGPAVKVPAARPSTTAPAAAGAPVKDTTASATGPGAAQEEFSKWLHRELTRGLDKLNANESE
jgi:PERQ amino acid-rich with GYF domain-containing protein